jgi:hypothetical protein
MDLNKTARMDWKKLLTPKRLGKAKPEDRPDFSRHVEKLTLNLTPQPPSLVGRGRIQSLSQE